MAPPWVHLIEHGADREDVASRVIFFGDVTVSRSVTPSPARTVRRVNQALGIEPRRALRLPGVARNRAQCRARQIRRYGIV